MNTLQASVTLYTLFVLSLCLIEVHFLRITVEMWKEDRNWWKNAYDRIKPWRK